MLASKKKNFVLVIIFLLMLIAFLLLTTEEFTETIVGGDSIYVSGEACQQGNITQHLIEGGEEKTAYLTFDDGPSENTRMILDVLKNYDAKATFFLLGEKAEQNPDLVKRIFAEGHTIGNHTYGHNYDRVYGTREEFVDEITRCENVIVNILGSENAPKLFRFPGGSKENWKYIYRNIAVELGYKFVDWNALNGDADGQPFSEERCMAEIKKYCTGEKNVVILMHDSNKKNITAKMMPQILDYLKEKGYNFRRIEN